MIATISKICAPFVLISIMGYTVRSDCDSCTDSLAGYIMDVI